MVVHEEHADFQMFEEDQAFEFPFGAGHTFMEEVEKHTTVKPTSGGVHVSTFLLDESCRGLVHSSSPQNFISPTSCENEYWFKECFLLVLHEEHEVPIFLVDYCRDIPCDVTRTHVLIQKEIKESYLWEI